MSKILLILFPVFACTMIDDGTYIMEYNYVCSITLGIVLNFDVM